MLFKTVYGPELETIFLFLQHYGPADRDELFKTFLPLSGEKMGPATNLEDALTFLQSGGMVQRREDGRYVPCGNDIFILQLLKNLRAIQRGTLPAGHPLDPWYLEIVEKIFIIPDRPAAFNLHAKVNALELPSPCSEEKLNAWRRVSEFLGLGFRIFGGFWCFYRPELVLIIINAWGEGEGPLQEFLEDHFSLYLPWAAKDGDVAKSLWHSLEILEEEGHIKLSQKQDLPSKSYFGGREIKWIERCGDGIAPMSQ